MPSSASEAVPYIIEYMRKYIPDPKRILDVGVGFGKLGFFVREYYEAKKHGRFSKNEWEIELIGIEIFKPYISNLQKLLYDKIIIGNASDSLKELGSFDAALLGDILEHFEKSDGYKLLDELLKHSNALIISTPNGFKEQKPPNRNKFEEHKSGWTAEDFKKYSIIKYKIIPRIRKNEELLVILIKNKTPSR